MSKLKRVRANPLPTGERYAPGDKQSLNGQKSFTFIELLTVMAIICILAAVVFSNVDDSQQAGEVAANRQSASVIDVALLEDLGFLADVLESASSLVADDFHDFMWTFARIGTSGSEFPDARRVEAFKLQTITEFSDSEGDSTLPGVNSVQLKYEQIL